MKAHTMCCAQMHVCHIGPKFSALETRTHASEYYMVSVRVGVKLE